ncbi:MAG: hypothetical protein OSA99_14245 [Acidimicrobiales bacterium]|nr:hypothetical protein [Acidimicrobiales bacterium]
MRRTLSLTALLGLTTALLAAPVASASTTAPAIDPADNTPFAGSGTAELLSVQADIPLADLSVADLGLSPVQTNVDTSATPRSTATAANLNDTLLGAIPLTGILAEATQSAPPDNAEPVENTILEVPAAPVLDLGVSTSRASARWPGDGVCLAPGESIADGYSETAGADVLAVDGVATVATVNTSGGVSYTQNAISTAEVPGETGRALVSHSTTQVDSVTVLAGTPLEVTIGVASTPTLTATATGQPGGASVSYSNPVVTIDAPDGGALEPLEEVGGVLDGLIKDTILGDVIDGLAPLLDPLAEAEALDVEILVGEETMATNTAADGTAATGAASVVQINLTVLGVLGDALLDVSVDVGPMTAAVGVPAGGINCNPDLPECSDGIDNDGEGTIDIDDPNCHTDGDPDNPDSYDPDDDDESSECNDGVDNADPEDDLADAADPGCHTDGDPNNPDSYDPNGPSETNEGQPKVETPGPLPRTGGDMPLAAAMAFGGLGLAALQLMRRRATA